MTVVQSIVAVLLALALGSFAGCSSMSPEDFQSSGPIFEPEKFFTGRTRSTGVLENRRGKPTDTVRTETHGKWVGETLHIEQELWFGSGKQQHRSWRLRKVGKHRYEATANDVVGTIHGEAYGNVLHWEFTLALSPGNPLANVRMSQWMYLQPDGRTMVNHSTIRKAGFFVTQVTEQFEHLPDP